MKTTYHSNQLTIFDLLERIKRGELAHRPYKNGLGELLPWEETVSCVLPEFSYNRTESNK